MIFIQVLRVLKPQGCLIVSDFVCAGDKSDSFIHPDTIQHVYKRLYFTKLHNHKSWRHVADSFPELELMYYESLNIHMRQFYMDFAVEAHRHDEFRPTDETKTSLGESYDQTALAIERNEIGMHLALFRRFTSE